MFVKKPKHTHIHTKNAWYNKEPTGLGFDAGIAVAADGTRRPQSLSQKPAHTSDGDLRSIATVAATECVMQKSGARAYRQALNENRDADGPAAQIRALPAIVEEKKSHSR